MILNMAYLPSHQVRRTQADFLQISVEIDLGFHLSEISSQC